MTRSKVIKAPNPFGEESRGGGTQPPAVSASTSFQPVTEFKVPGQTRETHRAYGHVLTERGWVKETEPWQT